MDFEPRINVNGKILQNYIGEPVSIFVKILGDKTGQVVEAQTTDGQNIKIQLTEQITTKPTEWVQVIGNVIQADSLRANEVITFGYAGEDFDTEGYNNFIKITQASSGFYNIS